MEEAASHIDDFENIVHEYGKEHLRLRVRVLQRRGLGAHVVVSNASSGIAYQDGRSWPGSFARDLEAGVFG